MFCEYLYFLFGCDNNDACSRPRRKQQHELARSISHCFGFVHWTHQRTMLLVRIHLKCVEILKFNLETSRRLTETFGERESFKTSGVWKLSSLFALKANDLYTCHKLQSITSPSSDSRWLLKKNGPEINICVRSARGIDCWLLDASFKRTHVRFPFKVAAI